MDKTMSTGAMAAERCRVLYEYLVRQGNQWTELIDICSDLSDFYPYMSWLLGVGSETFHDSNARVMITNDIRTINKSGDFEKIIISNKNGVKIASEEEAERYLRNQYFAALRRLKRLHILEKKANIDNQITFDNKVIRAFLEE